MNHEDQVSTILDKYSTNTFQIVQMDEDKCNEIEILDDVPIWLQGFTSASEAAKYWYNQFKALDEIVLDVDTLQIDC